MSAFSDLFGHIKDEPEYGDLSPSDQVRLFEEEARRQREEDDDDDR